MGSMGSWEAESSPWGGGSLGLVSATCGRLGLDTQWQGVVVSDMF